MKRVAGFVITAAFVMMALVPLAYAGSSEANGKVNTATDSNFKNEVLRAGVPVLCVFSADWCKYCKKLKPVLNEVARDYKGKVKVVVVNTDKSPDYCRKYDVEGIPALFMHDSTGSVTAQETGYMEKDSLVRRLGLDRY